MPLKFFHIERLEKNFQELKELRYKNLIHLHDFFTTPDPGEKINQLPLAADQNSPKLKIGDFWSGRDRYLWLSKEIRIPAAWENETIVGIFDFGSTGEGHNSGFESLLYLNNKLYQGVDSNHQEVLINVRETGSYCRLDFRLWSGLEGGGKAICQDHQIKRADLACLDEAADDLYYTGTMVVETIKILPENNYQKHNLEKILIKTMQMLNFTSPRSEEFYASVQTARQFLNNELDKIEKKTDLTVYCVGHTHIDVAWLWRLKHTREKLARSFSTVDRLMEKYNDYIFLQSQPQLYEYVKNDFPGLYSMIKKRVAQGKWEPSGSMWVEADCNLTSGESIVRQILLAKQFFKKEFNYENTFLWLPDVFGYSWALPQILKKSNIDTFITTKISWNEHNKLPYDTFIWRGIDGSEILTHFITTPDDPQSEHWFYTYNGLITPQTIQGIWDNYNNKDLNSDLLLAYGYGDGGGGVNRDMLENRRRIAKIPGLPRVQSGNVTEYLKKLHNNIKDPENNGYLHTWDSELYLEYHRGTYTSQAYNKKMNRKLELKLRNAEVLQVTASLLSSDWDHYQTQLLQEAWKIVLRNQFHDIIPGSSIQEVYADSKKEYARAMQIVDQVMQEAFKQIVYPDNHTFTLFNSSSWPGKGQVSIPLPGQSDGHFEDAQGNLLPMQIENKQAVVYVENIPPLSFQSIYWKNKALPQADHFTLTGNRLESNQYIIEWNDYGHLVQILDKKLNRNALQGPGNLLQIFEDKPRSYDAWEIESTIDLKKEVVRDFKGAKLISSGSHYIKIAFEWSYHQSTIQQNLILYHHLGRIDFETSIDWQEREKLLKVAFPVAVRATKARYDIQFGNVERPTHRSTSWEHAKFEVVGHQWADLSETGFGVALFNDCKYGYDIKDHTMRLSLLKSSTFPDPRADQGRHELTYSLFIHSSPWYASNLIREAFDLNSPLLWTEGEIKQKHSFFELDNAQVMIDAVKKSETGNHLIIRMHEQHGGRTQASIKLNFDFKCWYETDLMENKIGSPSQNQTITVNLNPYEISTILIELA